MKRWDTKNQRCIFLNECHNGITDNTVIGYDAVVRRLQIVIDTNVLVAALRSRMGAAFALLSLIGRSEKFEINLSVPLVMEYEDVALRPEMLPHLSRGDIEAVLDYVCSVGSHRTIFFLWRPFLRDPKDDMVLELAVEAQCDCIITFNLKDFAGVEHFGIEILTPYQFLQKIGELP